MQNIKMDVTKKSFLRPEGRKARSADISFFRSFFFFNDGMEKKKARVQGDKVARGIKGIEER